jgi:DNA polymerase III delta prime subunit
MKNELKSSDLDSIEMNAAERGLETVRQIVYDCHFSPVENRVVVFKNAHRLTVTAAEALVEVMGKPCLRTFFVLTTPYPEKVPETLRERCATFKVYPLERAEMAEFLRTIIEKESWSIGAQVVDAITVLAKGIPGSALLLLEQVMYLDEREMLHTLEVEKKVQAELEYDESWSGATGHDRLILQWLAEREATSEEMSSVTIAEYQKKTQEVLKYSEPGARKRYQKHKKQRWIDSKQRQSVSRVWLAFKPPQKYDDHFLGDLGDPATLADQEIVKRIESEGKSIKGVGAPRSSRSRGLEMKRTSILTNSRCDSVSASGV